MQKKIWKPIKDYEDYYEISNMGNVRSKKRVVRGRNNYHYKKGRLLNFTINHDGYAVYRLSKFCKRRSFLAHRLVCIAFLDNKQNKPCVNHINEIKTDNRVDNLEWCTPKENTNHGSCIDKIKESKKKYQKKVGVYDFDNNLINSFDSLTECSKYYNTRPSQISRVCLGERKQFKGMIFKYIENSK